MQCQWRQQDVCRCRLSMGQRRISIPVMSAAQIQFSLIYGATTVGMACISAKCLRVFLSASTIALQCVLSMAQ